ncbi:unnamed protein product [Polarella glacialis]|uniref:1-acyl-sn-glycerol-3-phosphate acyltransferase n=1 Tax=Polarella glacialis TaxID=89957 RepID=A0A813HRW2_POLGL|nr:unnamed protein product [Polarella glacialis]
MALRRTRASRTLALAVALAIALVAACVRSFACPSPQATRSSARGLALGVQSRGLSPTVGATARGAGSVEVKDDLERFISPTQRRFGHKPIAFVRAFLLLLTLYGLSIVIVPFIFLILPFVKRYDPLHRKLVDRCLMVWSKMITWPFFKVRVKGRENLLPEGQAVVYVANHQSFMDILSSFHLSRPFKWVSKASILKIPLVGSAMKAARTITIQREDKRSQLAAFRECVEALKQGTSIFVFPEGTRSPTGSLIEFKKGPFAMAKKAGVPIVPITILGTNRIMPSKKEYFLFQSSPGVEIIVHPPVSAEVIKELPDAELLAMVRGAIESALPKSLHSQVIAPEV